MNGFFVFGLLGVGYCGYQVYQAWLGVAGIPFGVLFGGALGGMGGAMIGGALAGDHAEKQKASPNVGGLIFWGFCCVVWLFITIAALAA